MQTTAEIFPSSSLEEIAAALDASGLRLRATISWFDSSSSEIPTNLQAFQHQQWSVSTLTTPLRLLQVSGPKQIINRARPRHLRDQWRPYLRSQPCWCYCSPRWLGNVFYGSKIGCRMSKTCRVRWRLMVWMRWRTKVAWVLGMWTGCGCAGRRSSLGREIWSGLLAWNWLRGCSYGCCSKRR